MVEKEGMPNARDLHKEELEGEKKYEAKDLFDIYDKYDFE